MYALFTGTPARVKSSTSTPAIGISPILSLFLSSRTEAQTVRVVTKVALRLASVISTLPSTSEIDFSCFCSCSESLITCLGRRSLIIDNKCLSAAFTLGTMQPKDKSSKPADTKSLPEDILRKDIRIVQNILHA